jgi:glutamine phosphoribosylpyrophosphate amidotransferase
MKGIDGSFSITGITDEGTLFAFKDPVGVKPMCYGCNGDVHAFSSESVGLDINGLKLQHELKPGELITISDGEFCKEQVARCNRKAFCAFEFAARAIIGPCFYGIDMSTYKELIGASLDPEGIAEELGADSVNYLSIEDYVKATGLRRDELCLGCVTGEYPTPRAMRLSLEMRVRLEDGIKEGGRIYEQTIGEHQQRVR